jgi:hypothetical protein
VKGAAPVDASADGNVVLDEELPGTEEDGDDVASRANGKARNDGSSSRKVADRPATPDDKAASGLAATDHAAGGELPEG